MIDLQRATVTVGGRLLPVKSLTTTLDESWTPYVQVPECRIALTDPAVLDVLDPRELARARVQLRREFSAPFSNADITRSIKAYGPGAELRRNYVRYPRAVAGQWTSGATSNVPNPEILTEDGEPFARFTRNNGSATALRIGGFNTAGATLPLGPAVVLVQVRVSAKGSPTLNLRRGSTATNLATTALPQTAEWSTVALPIEVVTAGTAYSIVIVAPTTGDAAGDVYDVRRAAIVPAGDYFDGFTPGADERLYGWAGAENASESIEFERVEVTPSNADLSAAWAGLSGAEIAELFTSPFNSSGARDPQVRNLDLVVQEARVDHVAAEVVLTLASDEALLQGHRLVQTVPYVAMGVTLRPLVAAVLARIGASLEPGTFDAPVTDATAEWLPGASGWDFLAPHIEKAGARLWCDEDRVWRLTDRAELVPGQLTLSTGADGSITRAVDTISRRDDDGYADAVVVIYRWTDAAKVPQVAYDIAGPADAGKVLVFERETPFPGEGAARQLLARAQGRGRTLDLSAVADFTVEPGQAARVVLPNTPTQTGLVSAVTWRLPASEMDVRTRGLVDTPPTAWAYVDAGKRWIDVLEGTSWKDFTNG